MPDERLSRLQERLTKYARDFIDFYMPSLAGEKTERSDGYAEIEMLYTPGLLKEDWRRLRSRVLSSSSPEPDPSEISIDGIRHLESIVDVLNRRIEDLKTKRRDEIQFQRTWSEALHSDDPSTADEETCLEALQGSEERLEEIDEKLSLARYRHSMAETMLTHIALFDTILPAEEFFQFFPSRENTSGQNRELSDSEKRTILVGMALSHYKEERDHLPSFESKQKFKEWAASLEHPLLLSYGAGTVENALRETDSWVVGKSGETGNNLRDIMNNCIQQFEQSNWFPSDEKVERVQTSAIESI